MVRKLIVAAAVAGLGLTSVAWAQSMFPDVPAGHKQAAAIEWAVKEGVTKGKGDGSFGVDDPLSRKHARVFIERFYDEVLGAKGNDSFSSKSFTRGDMMVLLHSMAGSPAPTTTTTTPPLPEGEWRSGDVKDGPGAFGEVVGVGAWLPGVWQGERPSAADERPELIIQCAENTLTIGVHIGSHSGFSYRWSVAYRFEGSDSVEESWPAVSRGVELGVVAGVPEDKRKRFVKELRANSEGTLYFEVRDSVARFDILGFELMAEPVLAECGW